MRLRSPLRAAPRPTATESRRPPAGPTPRAPTQPSAAPTEQPSQQTDTAAQTEKAARNERSRNPTRRPATRARARSPRRAGDGRRNGSDNTPESPGRQRDLIAGGSCMGSLQGQREGRRVRRLSRRRDEGHDESSRLHPRRPRMRDDSCGLRDGEGQGRQSLLACAATVATSACADVNPPSAPTSFRSEFATTTSAILVWNASTDNVGVTSYGIYDAASDPGDAGAEAGASRAWRAARPTTTSSTRPTPRAIAPPKVPATITTLACTDGQPPTKPAPVTVLDATPTAVTVSWPTATDNVGVDHYNVYRGAARGCRDDLDVDHRHGAVVRHVVLDRRQRRGQRRERVRHGEHGRPDGSVREPDRHSVAERAGRARLRPPQVQTSIGVTWAPATDNVGVTGYTVYRDGAAAGTTTATPYTVSGLVVWRDIPRRRRCLRRRRQPLRPTEAFLSTAACADTTRPWRPPR